MNGILSVFRLRLRGFFLTCGSEVEVVCKQLCRSIKRKSTAEKIHQYRAEIVQDLPDISGFEVLFPQFGVTLKPWDEWSKKNGVPFWWTAYNKTKHERHAEYQRANLKNMLNAVAGLFVMVLYLYKGLARRGELIPAPQLLHVGQEHFGGVDHSGNRMAFIYGL